ncbi:MAG: HAD hydrolase-like protein [Chitinivibrionales bacterium]|nr:HAD hydrolase-like protein [Chitinivibrionales bacterium]MBD3395546.1 HAD hydrolase-like protein [Chitinivibrionales bacterium]
MSDAVQILKDLEPAREFFIGIDSDGCVFDSMELKHKECFCPQFINHFGLQAVSKYARETWQFVNLYSTTRGVNRFKALVRALELLADRDEVKARAVVPSRAEGVRKWIERESKLGNPALKAEIERNPDPDLQQAMAWSLEVNEVIGKIVRDVPPFPGVVESIKCMNQKADTVVVSQTPAEALEREWKEHGIDGLVRAIAGQEMGTKAEHLALAARDKYPADKILMLGDAPGDFKAARANGALFYPVVPGAEEAAWQRFRDEALDRFFAGTYAGDYEKKLIREFEKSLPENPPWS